MSTADSRAASRLFQWSNYWLIIGEDKKKCEMKTLTGIAAGIASETLDEINVMGNCSIRHNLIVCWSQLIKMERQSAVNNRRQRGASVRMRIIFLPRIARTKASARGNEDYCLTLISIRRNFGDNLYHVPWRVSRCVLNFEINLRPSAID